MILRRILNYMFLLKCIIFFTYYIVDARVYDEDISLEDKITDIEIKKNNDGFLSIDTFFTCNELLSRPTDKSITIHLVPRHEMELFIDYGIDSTNFSNKTTTTKLSADSSYSILIDELTPNSEYFYCINYKVKNANQFYKRKVNRFHTQRIKSGSFIFDIEADPHLDSNSIPEAFTLTLSNIINDKPDFLIDLGDNFMSEKLTDKSQKNIIDRHILLRSFYEQTCHSVPLYLVLGNHEGEWGYLADNNAKILSVMTSKTRKKYFANPEPNTFYSGNTKSEPEVGLRQNYYSWEWGNSLFVVLDPYWYTNPKTGWGMTLGKEQYDWFKNALKSSNSKFKFVFCHNLVGGANKDMRGGVEAADFYEWGGKDTNGIWSFEKNRPGWDKPIHQLMVDYGVSIFFHGHDHFYGYQEKDGIIYQEVPQPSNRNLTNLSAGSYGYKSGTLLPGRGYLRLNVSENETKVEYVGTLLPNEEKGQNRNGYVVHSYSVKQKTNSIDYKIENNTDITLYPNPSSGLITVSCFIPNCNKASIEIFETISGKLIEKFDNVPIDKNRLTFNLINSQKLNNGSYFIKIISCNSIQSTNLIINQ